MTSKQFKKRFDRIKRDLSKARDDLRQLMADADDILESSERATEAIDDAANILSEHL